MGNVLRIIGISVGLLTAYTGYYEKPSTPSPAPVVPAPDTPTPVTPTPVVPEGSSIKIITPADETIAPAPTNPALLTVSAPIKQTLTGHPDDAIKLARAFHQWSQLIARDKTLKTTDEFQQAYIEATQVLFQQTQLAAKGYSINQPSDATFDAAFEAVGLLDTSTRNVKSGEWNATAQGAAAAAFDAISYQCFQAFLQSPKPQQFGTGCIDPEPNDNYDPCG